MGEGGVVRKILKNKPLVEAIFELKWKLQQDKSSEVRIDPDYRVFTGAIRDKLKGDYPFLELLPAAEMPESIIPYVVQQRFRKGRDEWPLVQIGPGIVTLNDTAGYTWEDFYRRIDQLVDVVIEAYPDSEQLGFDSTMLRYIDSVEFEPKNNNAFEFMKGKLKTDINMHSKLFEGTGVDASPAGIDLKFTFRSNIPKGLIELRMANGARSGKNALLWHIIIKSSGEHAPKTEKDIHIWLENAHNLTDDWFFKLIEGDLLKEFE